MAAGIPSPATSTDAKVRALARVEGARAEVAGEQRHQRDLEAQVQAAVARAAEHALAARDLSGADRRAASLGQADRRRAEALEQAARHEARVVWLQVHRPRWIHVIARLQGLALDAQERAARLASAQVLPQARRDVAAAGRAAEVQAARVEAALQGLEQARRDLLRVAVPGGRTKDLALVRGERLDRDGQPETVDTPGLFGKAEDGTTGWNLRALGDHRFEEIVMAHIQSRRLSAERAGAIVPDDLAVGGLAVTWRVPFGVDPARDTRLREVLQELGLHGAVAVSLHTTSEGRGALVRFGVEPSRGGSWDGGDLARWLPVISRVAGRLDAFLREEAGDLARMVQYWIHEALDTWPQYVPRTRR